MTSTERGFAHFERALGPVQLMELPELKISYAPVDPDQLTSLVSVMRVNRGPADDELPLHRHRKGQLVFTEKGSALCRTPDGLWIVPAFGAFWIPGGTAHACSVPANGSVICVFVENDAVDLPSRCCNLKVSPLVRVVIENLLDRAVVYPDDSAEARLARVLLDELGRMQSSFQHLPISADQRLRLVARALLDDPTDRSTIPEWAARVAMSERSFARLVAAQTGMTFGQWRRQVHILVAIERLSMGSPVQMIAQDLGYETTSAFINMFRKVLNMSPGQYLRSIAAEGGQPALR